MKNCFLPESKKSLALLMGAACMTVALIAGCSQSKLQAEAAPPVLPQRPSLHGTTHASKIPVYARGEVFNEIAVKPSDKVIALTFDDGPAPGHTERVLSILDENKVRATFFVIGANLAKHPDLGRAVRDAGHAIGNHTFNHLQKPTDPKGEVTKTNDLIKEVMGASTAIFRPPFGNFENGVVKESMKQGDAVIVWSCDPKDWDTPGADVILRDTLAKATPGGIVLLHDGGEDPRQTIEALPAIIAGLRERGYRFVTVPELLAKRHIASTTAVKKSS